MPMPNEPKALSPKELADQLFDAVFAQGTAQGKGSPQEIAQEAAGQVIAFLKEALIYALLSTGRDEVTKRGLLKSLGESIVALAVSSGSTPPTP
jgi:hypothetical protein